MKTPKFSDVIVERFARAWASIDGKAEVFDRERGMGIPDHEDWEELKFTGHFEGYMAEAAELLKRAGCYVSTSQPIPDKRGEE
jgi:hypothetical protein